MSTGGWVMLVGSWLAIIALNVFCFIRLFTERPAKSITGEGETPR